MDMASMRAAHAVNAHFPLEARGRAAAQWKQEERAMRVTLHPNEQATLHARGTVRVCCLGGTLWITGGDAADRLLGKDELAELPAAQARHLSSVAAARPVEFEMTLLPPSGRLRRVAAFLLRQLRQLA
jgi:hypothetical protein